MKKFQEKYKFKRPEFKVNYSFTLKNIDFYVIYSLDGVCRRDITTIGSKEVAEEIAEKLNKYYHTGPKILLQ